MSAARMTPTRRARAIPRSIFTVQHDATRPRPVAWQLLAGRTVILCAATQRRAIAHAVQFCRVLVLSGHRAQLRVREKNGTWGQERTYPDTTPRRRG